MKTDNPPSIELKNSNIRLNASHYLFLLFWLLKPFYFWESGTMQISDFIFVISFIIWVVEKRSILIIERTHLLFILFVLGTFIINTVNSVINDDEVFLISSLYYLYNAFMIISISEFKDNHNFLKGLLRISYMNIIIQFIVLILDQGRFFYGSPRYMGTFNDPNQFAFSMFTSFLLIYVLTLHLQSQGSPKNKPLVFIMLILVFYLIARSSSTGMLLGISSFIIFMIISYVFSKKTPIFTLYKTMFIIILFGVVGYFFLSGFNIDSISAQSDLVRRLLYKFNKVDANGLRALIEERGIDKLYNYPVYNILGAGDGLFNRFIESAFEIHSTLPGALFYYGIIPFALLIAWLWSILKRTSKALLPVYLAMLVESLTLANQRQPVFWMLLVFCGLTYSQDCAVKRTGIRVSL